MFSASKSSHKAIRKIENIQITQVLKEKDELPVPGNAELSQIEQIFSALVLGTRDYIIKNNFKSVVLGLSGGIDSALTAVIASDAIGPENVFGVAMPSMYSSEGSVTDAEQLAKNLGIQYQVIPIIETYQAYISMFNNIFKDLAEDITEENLQARIRGNIIMALSNKYGHLPLTTGNKSEVSVGYCTLYGDMAGGFAVIKDVPKTLVYELSEYVNKDNERIPKSTIIKPPSAELKPDQIDEDSLPPYEILDPILELYIEKDNHCQQIIDAGYDEKIVKRIIHLVDSSEYKRRQAPPGVKITTKAFERDRRIPITNRYQK